MARIVLHRRLWFIVAALIIALLPLVFQDSYWRSEPDRLRDQRDAGHRPRLYSRLRGTAQSRSLGVLRHRRLCLDLARHAARYAVLDRLRDRHRTVRRRRHGAVAVRGASARPLPRNRVARLCRHRPSGSAELDQRDAGAARHLCDQAAAGDRHMGIADRRIQQFGEHVLPGRRLRAPDLPAARPARALSDRRDPDGDPRGRSVGGVARHQLHALEGVRLWRRFRHRGRGRSVLRQLRRHARSGCLHHHRIIHDSRHGDRRRHGDADRAGLGRDPA